PFLLPVPLAGGRFLLHPCGLYQKEDWPEKRNIRRAELRKRPERWPRGAYATPLAFSVLVLRKTLRLRQTPRDSAPFSQTSRILSTADFAPPSSSRTFSMLRQRAHANADPLPACRTGTV